MEQSSLEEAATLSSLREAAGAFTPSDARFAQTLPPPPLFHNFVSDDTLILLSGEPGLGKTTLALDMALCLDWGLPLLGRFAPRECMRVLFIGQDAPTHDYIRQFRKLAFGHGLSADELSESEVTFLLNRSTSLFDPMLFAFLNRYVPAAGIDGIFIDTLSSLIPGIDQNDTTAMQSVMTKLKGWRDQFGLFIVMTAHVNKPSQFPTSANYRIRGSSEIAGSIDFHAQLSKRAKSTIHLDVAKGRGDSPDEVPPFTIARGWSSYGPTLTVSVPVEDAERVLGFLHKPLPQAKLMALLKHTSTMTSADAKTRTLSALEKLSTEGKVRHIGDGWWRAVPAAGGTP